MFEHTLPALPTQEEAEKKYTHTHTHAQKKHNKNTQKKVKLLHNEKQRTEHKTLTIVDSFQHSDNILLIVTWYTAATFCSPKAWIKEGGWKKSGFILS